MEKPVNIPLSAQSRKYFSLEAIEADKPRYKYIAELLESIANGTAKVVKVTSQKSKTTNTVASIVVVVTMLCAASCTPHCTMKEKHYLKAERKISKHAPATAR